MNAEQVISLISAISGLLGVLIWPLLILFIIVRFRSPLADFFSHLGEFSFKAPGLEASARRQQVEAAAALGAAVAANAGVDTAGAPANPIEVAQAVAVAAPDARAGITLLDRMRAAGNQTPYIVYASSRAQDLGDEARRRGAMGFADSPQELLVMVSRALGTPT